MTRLKLALFALGYTAWVLTWLPVVVGVVVWTEIMGGRDE